MAYIGNNPKLKSIVSSGDSLANLTGETRKAGRLAYATDVQQFVYDNGTTLELVGNCPNGVDTKVNLDALTRKQGNLYYATDDQLLYVDNGTVLVTVGGGFPLMAAGSIITSDGSNNGEFTSSLNDGDVLTVDTSAPDNTNLVWSAPSGTPVGTVLAYAGAAAPAGFLLCNGALLDRTVYAGLFTAIGTAFGTDTASDFRIPDLQGQFLRGVANGSGNDPDRLARIPTATGGNTGDAVGSEQPWNYQQHSHTVGSHTHAGPSHSHLMGMYTVNNPSSFPYARSGSFGNGQGLLGTSTVHNTVIPRYQFNTSTASGTTGSSSATGGNAGGNQTNPINVGVNFIIKY